MRRIITLAALLIASPLVAQAGPGRANGHAPKHHNDHRGPAAGPVHRAPPPSRAEVARAREAERRAAAAARAREADRRALAAREAERRAAARRASFERARAAERRAEAAREAERRAWQRWSRTRARADHRAWVRAEQQWRAEQAVFAAVVGPDGFYVAVSAPGPVGIPAGSVYVPAPGTAYAPAADVYIPEGDVYVPRG